MRNRFFNYIFLLILLSGLSATLHAQSIQVEAKLQDYTIKIGEQTRLFLAVHKGVNQKVEFPVLADTIVGKVQIVSANKPDTAIDQNDKSKVTITHSYTITCFDAGSYTIPPLAFKVDTNAVRTNELVLQVQTVKVDTTKAIYDIKQPLVVSYTFFDWLKDNWVWVVIGLIVVAAVVALIIYLRKRPKKVPVIKVNKPSVPIHTIALNKLKDLRDKKLWQKEEIKEYHSELTDILREYLEQRYAVKTHEKTTEEILAALRNRDITDEYRNILSRALTLADLVKFAKEKPAPNDNERSMDDAIEFVLKTQLVAIPKIDADGGGDNGSV